jgi:hypothetical protein
MYTDASHSAKMVAELSRIFALADERSNVAKKEAVDSNTECTLAKCELEALQELGQRNIDFAGRISGWEPIRSIVKRGAEMAEDGGGGEPDEDDDELSGKLNGSAGGGSTGDDGGRDNKEGSNGGSDDEPSEYVTCLTLGVLSDVSSDPNSRKRLKPFGSTKISLSERHLDLRPLMISPNNHNPSCRLFLYSNRQALMCILPVVSNFLYATQNAPAPTMTSVSLTLLPHSNVLDKGTAHARLLLLVVPRSRNRPVQALDEATIAISTALRPI